MTFSYNIFISYINFIFKCMFVSVTKNSVFVEFVNRGIAGPDQPIQVPKIRPPIVAVNAAKACGHNDFGGSILGSLNIVFQLFQVFLFSKTT